ncbi:uncharacterized protein DSM5745_04111 [Aspergillus mulundensis]|uniref:Uncharacterized protein n=1 Tax=Aspergillus mulundensis TaxID=1810919 RepID=A0A3D8SBS6_9EURO|nr:hypothetical protein DSM5745_04111 [Aspergillus mulundensis]RDW83785.1 hypothetical protein DSM5745_04111 [Aspergillus mulundensis]
MTNLKELVEAIDEQAKGPKPTALSIRTSADPFSQSNDAANPPSSPDSAGSDPQTGSFFLSGADAPDTTPNPSDSDDDAWETDDEGAERAPQTSPTATFIILDDLQSARDKIRQKIRDAAAQRRTCDCLSAKEAIAIRNVVEGAIEAKILTLMGDYAGNVWFCVRKAAEAMDGYAWFPRTVADLNRQLKKERRRSRAPGGSEAKDEPRECTEAVEACIRHLRTQNPLVRLSVGKVRVAARVYTRRCATFHSRAGLHKACEAELYSTVRKDLAQVRLIGAMAGKSPRLLRRYRSLMQFYIDNSSWARRQLS